MKIASLHRLIGMIIALVLVECVLIGYIAIWREWFWQAISDRHLKAFMVLLSQFSVAALLACLVSGYGDYLVNCTSLIMRTRLTKLAITTVKTSSIEGKGQRIQEDCFTYPNGLLFLLRNGLKNILILLIFTTIIYRQLGSLYLLFPLGYAVIGTIIAAYIAKPLIKLNYVNQVLEAKFRQVLTKWQYKLVHRNNHNLFVKTKFLAYFQSFYGQATIIIPYVILAPLYFSLRISFGVLMQCAASINSLIDALSFIINNFNEINMLLSCRKRLKELEIL